MINKKSIEHLKTMTFEGFLKPDYEKYCFSNIPYTIFSYLTENGNRHNLLPPDTAIDPKKKYDKVIFILIDAFGWNLLEMFSDSFPVLKELLVNGKTSKLTSQFPSTTTAEITTLHSGMQVQQHGIMEWFYYEPEFDDIFAPFMYRLPAQKNTVLSKAADTIDKVFDFDNIYSVFKEKNIESFLFMPASIVNSPYTRKAVRNSVPVSYTTFAQGLSELLQTVTEQEKGYFQFYYSELDSICHLYGPYSKQAQAQLTCFMTSLEEILFKKLPRDGKTLFILSADHGQTTVKLDQGVYINNMEDVVGALKKNSVARPLVPGGSYRDFFIYVQHNMIDETAALLTKNLESTAKVIKTKELLDQNFFGSSCASKKFLSRVGDICILPYQNTGVWWYAEDVFSMDFKGMHGGLTKEEMEIPYILYEL